MRVKKDFKGTQQVYRKNNKLMDIRFSIDMQSTKDTKYIFKKSDLNLPYSKFFILFVCIFVCVELPGYVN